jgi:hypothetical protein
MQLETNHDHIDISKPNFCDDSIPDIYSASRDAIAVWLQPLPPQPEEPKFYQEFQKDLLDEVSIFLQAAAILISSPNEQGELRLPQGQ